MGIRIWISKILARHPKQYIMLVRHYWVRGGLKTPVCFISDAFLCKVMLLLFSGEVANSSFFPAENWDSYEPHQTELQILTQMRQARNSTSKTNAAKTTEEQDPKCWHQANTSNWREGQKACELNFSSHPSVIGIKCPRNQVWRDLMGIKMNCLSPGFHGLPKVDWLLFPSVWPTIRSGRSYNPITLEEHRLLPSSLSSPLWRK